MRVLIVEDEQRLARAIKRGLEDHGFAVDLAHDGLDGLAQATAGDHDAVVLDIVLPGLHGYEVLKRLRAREIWTPVLMLTAKDGEYDEADALDLGADDYLRKPFSYVVLIARLKRCCVATAGSAPHSSRSPTSCSIYPTFRTPRRRRAQPDAA